MRSRHCRVGPIGFVVRRQQHQQASAAPATSSTSNQYQAGYQLSFASSSTSPCPRPVAQSPSRPVEGAVTGPMICLTHEADAMLAPPQSNCGRPSPALDAIPAYFRRLQSTHWVPPAASVSDSDSPTPPRSDSVVSTQSTPYCLYPRRQSHDGDDDVLDLAHRMTLVQRNALPYQPVALHSL
ncbi:hypothetical protein BO71DRAFT_43638 [Aspergillus ellipticus CBS 707.79]|uniref:Uncharacterized protein n=1 Tax=Aspergillus ellipticus CBS 707.79 TaxID=1448320 RepID=A0A319D3D9_9EURO|nr:hypothetical protein BO71DRAFT_43638 [Aspergillus ellipticus CBS 707.79]